MLNNTIYAGLNNPECAFFVGQWFGAFTMGKLVFAYLGLLLLYKFIDKLAIEPLINKLKNKWCNK